MIKTKREIKLRWSPEGGGDEDGEDDDGNIPS